MLNVLLREIGEFSVFKVAPILIILFILNFLGLIPPIKKVFNKILKKIINVFWLILRIKKWYKIFRISILWDLTDLQGIDSIYITLSL